MNSEKTLPHRRVFSLRGSATIKPEMKSPWLIIALGIFGLVVGYGIVVFGSGTVFANGGSCPFKDTVCASEECTGGESCAKGECAHCTGCQHHG